MVKSSIALLLRTPSNCELERGYGHHEMLQKAVKLLLFSITKMVKRKPDAKYSTWQVALRLYLCSPALRRTHLTYFRLGRGAGRIFQEQSLV